MFDEFVDWVSIVWLAVLVVALAAWKLVHIELHLSVSYANLAILVAVVVVVVSLCVAAFRQEGADDAP